MDNELLLNISIAAIGVDGEVTDEEIDKLVEVLAEFDITEDEISDGIDNIEEFDVDAGLSDFEELPQGDQQKIIKTLKKIFASDSTSRKESQLVINLQKIADASNS
ncbi:hypothetical protein [Leptospira sp. 'Mane']|uniref:hypothetical protein n=1 Tax=Leptospira sp. 'Mane' TaxID=3387407 RepID=UPI00398B3DDB